jgi:Ser/Thr protein kinase RdoA (MazF antagonist)
VELPPILAAYDLELAGARAWKAPSGLINQTVIVELATGRRVVAQKIHPIFGEGVNHDIDAITRFLEGAGMATPRVVPARGGALGVRDDAGALWRVMTYLDGHTVDRVESPAAARAAGALVARFHRAVAGLDHTFAFARAGVHDTVAHLAKLATFDGPLVDEILSVKLPAVPELPKRIAHGDLKISNVIFDERGGAVALIDLDTLGRMTMAYELGDAWRSWCNPLGEDVEETRFDVAVFEAAVRGYASASALTPDERASIVAGIATVCVELAARFAVDHFEDKYFGWDPARFPSRKEHNRVRARGQLALGKAVLAARATAERIVSEAF